MPDSLRSASPRHARLSTFLAASIAATLCVACTSSPPAASPSPVTTPEPTSPATPAAQPPSVTPTAPATPTPVPTQAAGEISHPTGAKDVVLRMEEGGGHMMFGFDLTQAPTFTLYGDGTFVLRQSEDPEVSDMSMGFPRFLTGKLSEEYVQALLRFALGTGRLLDAKADYPNNTCADCSTTTFTLDAAGVAKTVSVYALGMVEGGPDAADRRGFAELRETIVDLERRAKSGELGEAVIYDPDLYRVVLLEGFGEAQVEWPWSQITAADFEPAEDGNYRALVMSREDVGALVRVPSGGHMGVVVADGDGTIWQIGVRPLLPDEIETDSPAGASADGAYPYEPA